MRTLLLGAFCLMSVVTDASAKLITEASRRHNVTLSSAVRASWSDDDFAAAYRQRLAYKTTVVSAALQTLWGAEGHGRFNIAPPALSCKGSKKRYGEGDGGKWICELGALQFDKSQQQQQQQRGCVIYSMGSNYDFQLEEALAAETPCELHTFDCSVSQQDARFPLRAEQSRPLPPVLHGRRGPCQQHLSFPAQPSV